MGYMKRKSETPKFQKKEMMILKMIMGTRKILENGLEF